MSKSHRRFSVAALEDKEVSSIKIACCGLVQAYQIFELVCLYEECVN